MLITIQLESLVPARDRHCSLLVYLYIWLCWESLSPVLLSKTGALHRGWLGLKGDFWMGGGKLLSFRHNPQSPTFFIEYTPITGFEEGGGDWGYYPPITPCLSVCYLLHLLTPSHISGGSLGVRQTGGVYKSCIKDWPLYSVFSPVL